MSGISIGIGLGIHYAVSIAGIYPPYNGLLPHPT